MTPGDAAGMRRQAAGATATGSNDRVNTGSGADRSGRRPGGYRQPIGTEPRTARSAIGLRRVLAVLALVGSLIAGFFFWRATGDAADVVLIICLVVAASAALDLVYLSKRRAG